tara:strand:- start:1256 stop:1438 length:183 start_codon:yes stop_codon:yes gene_type:complete
MEKQFSLAEIKRAVDIAIGDDGFRSKEVCDILKTIEEEKETLYMESQIDRYCDIRTDTNG